MTPTRFNGTRALSLCLSLLATSLVIQPPEARGQATPAYGIAQEIYTNLSAVAYPPDYSFTNTPANISKVLSGAFSTSNQSDRYGERLRAFLLPPVTGNYVLGISSDEWSDLSLSTDETPEGRVRVANVNNATAPKDYTAEPNQLSAPILLEGGRRYFLEVLHRDGVGPDSLDIQWLLPDGSLESSIAVKPSGRAERLIPFRPSTLSAPAFLKQPTNTPVVEGRGATLVVLAANQTPLSYQWQMGGVDIPGATKSILVVPKVTQAQHGGKTFRCVATNSLGSSNTTEVSFLVAPDTLAPTVTGVASIGGSGVLVTFSEGVESSTATSASNYQIPGVSILGATLAANGYQVVLKTSALVDGGAYVLGVSEVTDLAGLPVAPGLQVSFTAQQFYSLSLGGPSTLGTMVRAGNGYDITAAGADIGGKTDQFFYAWAPRGGDFDVQVRVASVGLSDLLARGGLMAREELSTTSRFAAVFATPSLNGCFFESRIGPAKDPVISGNVPVNYPGTWLRLQRSGNTFRGYASPDAVNWKALGSVVMGMPEYLYLGVAVSSHTTNLTTGVQVRDLEDATGRGFGEPRRPERESAGPASRRTGLTISEVHYHAPSRADGRLLEFVEIFNSQPFFEDIGGYTLTGDIQFTFPTNTLIQAGSYIVVARAPADIEAVYGLTGVFGPYGGALQSAPGRVQLRNELGGIFQDVSFETDGPWPVSADGAGHSLVLAHPSFGEGDVRAWSASDRIGGTPGGADYLQPDPLRGVVINEFLANPDTQQVEFLELFNSTPAAIDLSGAYLTDSASTNKYRIPQGVRIDGRGFIQFPSSSLGFGISSAGESLYLVNPSQTRVIDAIRFKGSARGVSQGRSPDGASGIVELATPTGGAPNSSRKNRDIVINEIMYAPISADSDDEFIELYNKGTQPVSLGGWKLTHAVAFTFPTNAVIPPDGYVVVGRNVARLLANYGNLSLQNTFGNYNGSLGNSGDDLRLEMPEGVPGVDARGNPVTNLVHVVVNEVAYRSGGRWGRWADAGGSSLELIDPRSDNRQPSSWADSDETRKGAWTTIERTGFLDLGGMADPTEVHIFLQDAGEALVDDLEIFPTANPVNVVKDAGFEDANLSPAWTVLGTHEATTLEKGDAFSGNQSLHIRASGRGDIGGNKIRSSVGFTKALNKSVFATIRAKVRWLAGNPYIMVRLYGNYLECPALLDLPKNLGTPGARNSRRVLNAGPTLFDVSHFPVLPAANQPVVITARATDIDGVGSMVVRWRNDTAGALVPTEIAMVDDGTGGDVTAGDGLYTAVIPGQRSGVMIAYSIAARDSAASPASSTFPNDAPVRECLVHVGETQPATSFGSYRIWVTQATQKRWETRGKQSNHPLDCTFVYNDQRVIYNAQTLYSGSPWHTPNYTGPLGAVCDYVVHLPPDDLFLGAQDMVLASIGNQDNDPTKLGEQTSYWIARKMGVPYNYRRFFLLYFNGVQRATSVYEDTQQPNGDLISEYYSNDTGGRLYKIEDWFEFDSSGDSQIDHWNATLDNWTTVGGVKKPARYRVNWRPRSVGAGQSPDDFSDLYDAVDSIFAPQPEPFETMVKSEVHIDRWFRLIGMEHIVGNWDSWGSRRGKNMFAYKPTQSRWDLLLWDIDFDLGSDRGSDDAQHDVFEALCDNGQPTPNEPSITRLFAYPAFRRHYIRILEEAAQGPLRVENLSPLLDAKYKALLDNGHNPGSLSQLSQIKAFATDRRSYLLGTVVPKTNFVVLGPTSFETNVNSITITGAAPVVVDSILINGVKYPTSWGSVAGKPILFSIRVPLAEGTNTLVVEAQDRFGNTIADGTKTLQVIYTGGLPDPAGLLLINEISYDPLDPGSAFIELYNRSQSATFDLSGWRLSGVNYDFPPGASIAPGGFLVVAKDLFAFGARFHYTSPVLGAFPGNLASQGETLALLRPSATPGGYLVVDQVRYENATPWPEGPVTGHTSLELVDSARDNARVSNWTDEVDGWRFYSVTGKVGGTNLFLFLSAPGDAWIDDVRLVEGTIPANGANLVVNGDFEDPLSGTWRLGTNLVGSAAAADPAQHGTQSLHLVSSSPGKDATNASLSQVVAVVPGNVYTLSYWLRYGQGSNLVAMTTKTLASTQSVAQVFGSPGKANFSAGQLPSAYPALWLNEVVPNNVAGLSDPQGEKDPWVELINTGGTPIDLSGMYLSDSYTNLTAWRFPDGAVIAPGEFKVVWVDGDADLTTAAQWHTSFRVQPAEGAVVLSRLEAGVPQILDYLNYEGMQKDESYGSIPDGQPFNRIIMSFPTPGGANNGASRPLGVRINEWMAANSGFLLDPATVPPSAEDWFELYNPGRTEADLSGYYLTDNLLKPTQVKIPAGTRIPAGGYLLVWADGLAPQFLPNDPDLHVSFRLAQSGEELGLFAPDGTMIDGLKFGPQTNNISQGRLPDGGSALAYFTQPTPRAANRIAGGNTAPVLGHIGDRTIDERRRFSIQLAAADAEEGSDSLVFSLAPGGPSGATLTPSGLFIWRPTEAQGPGQYSLTFRVRDNGTPNLEATETVTFTVREVNSAPVFLETRPRYVKAGDTVTFPTAIDLDLPAQSLSFRLGAGAPSGLTLDPVTGVVSWKPTEAQAPGQYPVTVFATDGGEPSLTSSFTYELQVFPGTTRVILLDVRLETVGVRLQWNTEPGETFQVEFKTGLAQEWQPLGTPLAATGASLQAVDPTRGSGLRLYRVRRL